jgi:polysaccharide export outer membrane protein
MTLSPIRYRTALVVFAFLAPTPFMPSGRGEQQADVREAAELRVLGSGDQVQVFAVDAEELSGKSFQVDGDGNLRLPIAGAVRVAGLTIEQAEAKISERLQRYIREPEVHVTVTSLKSQPVSVLGAVNTPGVHQLDREKTVAELLSAAGGLTKDAGYQIKLTRVARWCPIPLPSSTMTSDGAHCTAEINARALTEASNPKENIVLRPDDVITVPRAQVVYVIGEVRRAGGFTLGERSSVSVLQALALAEGLTTTASPARGRVLREGPGGERTEIRVNLSNVLSGKEHDLPLNPNDILFVPDNKTRKLSLKVMETALTTLSGIIIWRGL